MTASQRRPDSFSRGRSVLALPSFHGLWLLGPVIRLKSCKHAPAGLRRAAGCQPWPSRSAGHTPSAGSLAFLVQAQICCLVLSPGWKTRGTHRLGCAMQQDVSHGRFAAPSILLQPGALRTGDVGQHLLQHLHGCDLVYSRAALGAAHQQL